MMTMSPRERMIAISVGAIALLVLGYFGWSWIGGMYTARETQIAALRKDIREAKLKEAKGKKAVRQLHEFRARALPSATDVARTVYQGWLYDQLAAVKLEGHSVTTGATRAMSIPNLGHELSFTAKGQGTLTQCVQLLDHLQRPDYLQRINRLTLKPLLNSKLFDISISLEAIALDKADAVDAMPQITSTRLKLASVSEYETAICDRNLFGPKNNPPALRAPSSQTATINKEFSYTVEAKDPDPLDQVTYRLESDLPGLTLDAKSGKVRWQPKEKGTFEFTVHAKDDGLPAKESLTKIVVNVVDPPPPPVAKPTPPAPPKKLDFDHAKYTILAGVTDVNGQREVWLLNRPKGEMLKLHIGDKFAIGSINGTVESIGEEDFIFMVGPEPRRLYKGETLEEALIWDGN